MNGIRLCLLLLPYIMRHIYESFCPGCQAILIGHSNDFGFGLGKNVEKYRRFHRLQPHDIQFEFPPFEMALSFLMELTKVVSCCFLNRLLRNLLVIGTSTTKQLSKSIVLIHAILLVIIWISLDFDYPRVSALWFVLGFQFHKIQLRDHSKADK